MHRPIWGGRCIRFSCLRGLPARAPHGTMTAEQRSKEEAAAHEQKQRRARQDPGPGRAGA